MPERIFRRYIPIGGGYVTPTFVRRWNTSTNSYIDASFVRKWDPSTQTWIDVWPLDQGPTINVGGGNFSSFMTSNFAQVSITFQSTGQKAVFVMDSDGGTTTTYANEWLDTQESGIGSGYEIRANYSGDPLSSGSSPVNQWLSLSSTRSWNIFMNTNGDRSETIIIEIRPVGGNIVSGTYNLSVNFFSFGGGFP